MSVPTRKRRHVEGRAGRPPPGWLAGGAARLHGGREDRHAVGLGQGPERLASVLPTLIGGSADLAPSNNTYLNEQR